tara:strand:+ start:609 stop:1487 length:879 start_codon:yes stop_codon:yes gene_type:complete
MRIYYLLLGLLFVILWSSAFSVAKLSINYAPPLLVLSLRFFFSFLICITIIFFQFKKISFNYKSLFPIVLFGLFQNSIYLSLNFISLKWINAGLVVTINSLVPLVVFGILFFIFKEKISKISTLGLVFGCLGILLIFFINIEKNKLQFLGIILCFCATVSISLATVLIKRINNENLLYIISIQMLTGFVTILPLSFLFENWSIDFNNNFKFSFLYLVLGPGILANYIFLKLSKKIGPAKASSLHFLNPILGLISANIILSENILYSNMIIVLTISLAIIFINFEKNFKNQDY